MQVWECCFQWFLWIWTGHSKVSNLTRGGSTGQACENRQLKILKLAMTTRIEIRHLHFEEVLLELEASFTPAQVFGPP